MEDRRLSSGGVVGKEEEKGEQVKEAKREAMGLCTEEGCYDEEQVHAVAGLAGEEEDQMAAEIQADLIFSDEAFPSLPDFPCLSSPSNAACQSSSSSSSSAPWAVEGQHAAVPPLSSSSPALGDVSMSMASDLSDGKNVALQALDSDSSMDLLTEMDLLASAAADPGWGPSPMFPNDEEAGQNGTDDAMGGRGRLFDILDPEYERAQRRQQELMQQQQLQFLTLEEGLGAAGQGSGCSSEELAMVFLAWLRSNKEAISPQDLRSIRLRRSTIECAARNLGGGREGMKKLLKLILTWVQNHHLQKKRRPSYLAGEDHQDSNIASLSSLPSSLNLINPNFVHTSDTTGHGVPACNPWVSAGDTAVAAPSYAPMISCGGDALYSPAGATTTPMQPFCPSPTFNALEPIYSWALPMQPPYPAFHPPTGRRPSTYVTGGLPSHYSAAGQLFHHGPGEPLVRLAASATKEARKKRMARHRRFSSLHHHQQQGCQKQQQLNTQPPLQQPQLEQCTSGLPGEVVCSQMHGHGNWSAAWPSGPASSQQVAAAGEAINPTMQQQRQHNFPAGCNPSERRQGWKSEKNLRFLLQKVLKQSDVGSLGRIVLPKKEAELHLPELDARDGVSIAMEDISTSRTWNMRYRFWPNNKSRMYLLENTGDFVRSNGLQEGDFIVIYSDVTCGKYMIRGVKARQQADAKADGRSSGKHTTTAQKNGHGGGSHAKGSSARTGGSGGCNLEKREAACRGSVGREREAVK